MAYWVTFTDGTAGCVELVGEERPALPVTAKVPASEERALWAAYNASCLTAVDKKATEYKPDKKVDTIKPLPYPANPRIGTTSSCPPFCWRPAECQGRTSCPRAHACDD